jgi:hypothetical protein
MMTDPLQPEVAILNKALELPPAERPAFLHVACQANASLRQEIEALLQAHEQANDFLAASPTVATVERTAASPARRIHRPVDRALQAA